MKKGFDQLKLWYQSLDDLLAQKTRIEKEVYLELRNLFSLQPDLAFSQDVRRLPGGAAKAESQGHL